MKLANRLAKKIAIAAPFHILVRALRPEPIFQIGFNKCGTVSLHRFLRASGIRSKHWEEETLALRMTERIDAGQDPIRDYPRTVGFTDMMAFRHGSIVEPYKRFEYLHHWYPRALFVLNTRDRENWIASRAAHAAWEQSLTEIYAKCLSIPEANVADYWRAEWEIHHVLVRAYFRGAVNFLEYNIERDNPNTLVSFIASRYPTCANTPFEVHNSRKAQVISHARH